MERKISSFIKLIYFLYIVNCVNYASLCTKINKQQKNFSDVCMILCTLLRARCTVIYKNNVKGSDGLLTRLYLTTIQRNMQADRLNCKFVCYKRLTRVVSMSTPKQYQQFRSRVVSFADKSYNICRNEYSLREDKKRDKNEQ